ncbi:hypothetical protein AWC38_SpisGene342 [Stylophora pistillata]|uniref:Uncharacterized protein n=1 Tax=Stylophora pistillata TaxID=50429 RepID=A0A2B4T1W6_STYPI|nr:hypothetical protein AWC38_SpisGene342 [Stylophora pistillata]
MAEKDKYVLEEQVKEIRRKLSIAKAELDRVKKNGKITRKGGRNRKLSLQECKLISVEELVNLMEKEKSRLRKLKRAYAREKKTEEARKINKMFQQDPRRVYSSLREMASEQANKERPKYEGRRETESGGGVFENIEQAVFAASREKLRRVMFAVRGAMKDIGLEWNERKCPVAQVKRGTLEPEEPVSVGDSEREVTESLDERSHYKFLGIMESTKPDDNLIL